MAQQACQSQRNEADFHRLVWELMSAKAGSMKDQPQSDTALVLFSGGQDSATCLAWALERFARVEMLGFSYGQRHAIELECRDRLLDGIKSLRVDWAAKLGEAARSKGCSLIDAAMLEGSYRSITPAARISADKARHDR